MWSLLYALLALGGFFLIILLFGLVKVGRRADEVEERIIEILVSQSPQVRIAGDVVIKRKRPLSSSASEARISADQ